MNLVRYAAIPEFTAVYGHNLRAKYHQSSSKKKTLILNEISDLSGMPRKSIIRTLNRKQKRTNFRQGPKPTYDPEQVLPALKSVWLSSDQMCSKKLKSALRHWLPFYEKEHDTLSVPLRDQLLEG